MACVISSCCLGTTSFTNKNQGDTFLFQGGFGLGAPPPLGSCSSVKITGRVQIDQEDGSGYVNITDSTIIRTADLNPQAQWCNFPCNNKGFSWNLNCFTGSAGHTWNCRIIDASDSYICYFTVQVNAALKLRTLMGSGK
jgi:hypothetical protein